MPTKKKNNFNEVFETVELAREFLTMQLDASKSHVTSLGYDWDKLIDIVKDEENNSSLLVFAREVNKRTIKNDEGEEEEINESSEEKTKIYMEKELNEIAENVKSIYEATSDVPFDDGTIRSLDSKEGIEEYVEELFDVLIQARDYVNSEKEIKNLEEEACEKSEEFIKSRNTLEYEEGQDKRCKEWKKELEEYEADERNRQKNYRKIRNLKERIMLTEQRYSQEFFFDSIPSVERLKETFFKDRESAYTMQRFSAKCKTLGISPNFYTHFFFIEEKFLPEEYHPFSNLFLYTVIRYIAWSDAVNDRFKINAVVRALYKLMDNRFVTDELRETYVNAIEKYLDQFKVWEDEFREKNIMWKEHPKRIAKEKERESKYRDQLYGNIMKMGYAESIDETLQNMTLEELREFIDKKNIEKLEAAKKAGEEKAKAEVEEDETDENTPEEQNSNPIVFEGEKDQPKETSDEIGLTDTLEKVEENEDE